MPKEPHDTDLYVLGKGVLYIAEWSGGLPTDPDDYVDVGNCTSFEVEPVKEVLDHYSSRSGARTKDKTVTLETRYTVTFTLDEISIGNMKRFLGATVSGAAVRALQDPDKEYAMKFVSDNPVGKNFTARFWRMTLVPNGSMQFISDEWMDMSYTGEGLSDIENNPNSPLFTVTFSTTTTSTSSTSSSSTTTSTAP